MPPQVLTLPINTDGSWEIDGQSVDSLGNSTAATGALVSDGLEARVWQGDQTTSIFTPNTAWIDAPNFKLSLSITAAMTASLAPGIWPLEVAWLPGSQRVPVWGGWLELTDAPGSAAIPPTYSTYQHAIQYGGTWLKALILEQGLGDMLWCLARARTWLDEIIIGHVRRRVGRRDLLLDPSILAPTEAPNATIQGYLDSNFLLIRPRTIEICSHKAISLLCEKQFSGEKDDPYLARAVYHQRRASDLIKTYRAEIDVNADGLADLVFHLGYFSIR